MKKNKININIPKKNSKSDDFILSYEREGQNFYDDNICKKFSVPVEGGELNVYHHKPKTLITKRPIIFIPGFGTPPLIWRDFHKIQHEKSEYYYLETRDKKSANIKRNIKNNLSIDWIAQDISKVIEYFGLSNKDYVLMANCLNGGVVLQGLARKHLDPPTVIVFDPFTKWTQNRFFVKFVLPIMPAFVLGLIKYLLATILMANMKNKVQKERNKATIDNAIAWKWRKFAIQNNKFDLTDDFKKIDQEIFVFHGPKDKYHPEGTFRKVAKQLPRGRFFYLKISEHLRELLAGIIAFEFAKITKDEGVPDKLKSYEIDLVHD